jgi:hypothetical protein
MFFEAIHLAEAARLRPLASSGVQHGTTGGGSGAQAQLPAQVSEQKQ